jgi:hypothetical protein
MNCFEGTSSFVKTSADEDGKKVFEGSKVANKVIRSNTF